MAVYEFPALGFDPAPGDPGITYQVTSKWIEKFVADGVFR
jgi:hypothetical protein